MVGMGLYLGEQGAYLKCDGFESDGGWMEATYRCYKMNTHMLNMRNEELPNIIILRAVSHNDDLYDTIQHTTLPKIAPVVMTVSWSRVEG